MNKNKKYIDMFRSSRDRCVNDPGFFVEFKKQLSNHIPTELTHLLADFDTPKKESFIHQVLHHAGGFDGSYDNLTTLSDWLDDINRQRLKLISSSHFLIWFNVLLDTVKQYDEYFNLEIESAWRHAISPCLALLQLSNSDGLLFSPHKQID